MAVRDRRDVVLMFIDLDRFKLVNDTLGHEAGDCLLQEASQRIANCLRTGRPDNSASSSMKGIVERWPQVAMVTPWPCRAITRASARNSSSLARRDGTGMPSMSNCRTTASP